MRCSLVQGNLLARWKLDVTALVGRPVSVLLAALTSGQNPGQPNTETLRQMCLAALDGTESATIIGPLGGINYSAQMLPLTGAAKTGMLLLQPLPPEPEFAATLSRYIEAAPDAMIVVDTYGKIILANGLMEDMFGYSPQTLIGQPVELLLPERLRRHHQQHHGNYAASPKTRQMGTGMDLLGITQDRREFPVDISLSPVETPGGRLVLCAIRDVSEQKRIEATLREAREELERRVKERTADLENRNEELDAFAQTVAHDLKNPLAIITGMAELMLQYYSELSDAEIIKYLELITRDGHRLDNIINELMVLSGLEHLEPMLQPTNVARVAEEAIVRLESMVKQYQATIICQCDWPWANSYAPWLETVWVNYISNAIKYGGKPPVIELGADTPANGLIRYWIKDNGNGLTESEQRKLFTAFTRLSDVRIQGYGVGLSIVKRAVEKLGGQVGVESRPGSGSLFFFTLPAAQTPSSTDKALESSKPR
ncbi:MAG: hypothetical protein Kow0031_19150 [Anaerolineae bacterium]